MRLVSIRPCVQAIESGLQFLTDMLTDDPNRSSDLKLKESDLQVVSQKVWPVLLLLLLQATKPIAIHRTTKKFLIILKETKVRAAVLPFKFFYLRRQQQLCLITENDFKITFSSTGPDFAAFSRK